MALSYFTESEAPRDFRVSSSESDGHYKKCLLCYTVKRNFYCPECIRTGNFVHSSMPYSDRFSEKQAKLLRLKANRRHVLDRCERMLCPKIKRDTLLTECKQSRDKIDLLKLAIEQRRTTIEEKKKELSELVQYNNELRLKLPRYQKRVSSLGKHAQVQRAELQNRVSTYGDQTQSLAALRRSRIRQLTKYIFPVYMTYDSSDSIEDMEFVGGDAEEEPQKGCQLHIGAPWISADGDFSEAQAWASANKECAPVAAPGGNALHRSVAALGLAAQLVALLAATLDVRPPHPLALHEYCNWRVSGAGVAWRARRLCACVAALCARGGVPPPGAGAPLAAVDALCLAAAADAAPLGRVEAWTSDSEAEAEAWEAWAEAWCDGAGEPEDAEPEHLHWPEGGEMEAVGGAACAPAPAPAAAPAPAPPPSLVTSTVASIASMWRGWTK